MTSNFCLEQNFSLFRSHNLAQFSALWFAIINNSLTVGLHRPLSTRTILQILPRTRNSQIRKIRLDFLSEIHLAERFCEAKFVFYLEIRNPDFKIQIRISKSRTPLAEFTGF